MKVTILQINTKDEQNIPRLFTSMSRLKEMGLEVEPSTYRVAYDGVMDVNDVEEVYMKLQGVKPNGYKGHSLSISDIVVMDGKYLFCDSFGFVDVSDKF